ncbi:BRCT domain-containing protein [Diplocarpon rosae]|nr:BRCT domain-containing protein [Diplocarpon rosae]
MADHDGTGSRQTIPFITSDDVSKPLAGCVICCTSVPDEKRTQLADYAKQMGALHTYDLTLEVTHLIVGEYDTPKYRYVARNRMDVQPMMITWIEAVRELWINDQEIDMPLLEQQYRLPTFHSLRFSMTGCDDPNERLEISEKVRANGASYEGDLTKSITHLISFRTEGAKYKAAKSWKLQIVSIEWLRDSLERGMILDEKLYDPALPILERGKDAWDKTKLKRTSLGKRNREGSTASLDSGKRKLRRTASTKLSTQHEALWGDIVGGGGGSMIPQVNRSGIWETSDEGPPIANHKPPLIAEEEKQDQQPTQSTVENQRSSTGMFSGCRFFAHGFPRDRIQVLQEHLVPHGAELANTIEDLLEISPNKQASRLFRMVPADLPLAELPTLPDSQLPVETITYLWVERCLHHKKFIEPNDHVVGRPFPKFPIEGFQGMAISSSAFTGIDLLHFARAVRLLGAEYREDFTSASTVLVTKSLVGLRKDKYDHAMEWRIPILNADWVWDSIATGTKLSFSKYRCRSQKRDSGRCDSLPSTKKGTMSELPSRHERASSDITRAPLRSSSHSSGSSLQPPRNSGLDNLAFAAEGCAKKPYRISERPPRGQGLDKTAFSTGETVDETVSAAAKHSRAAGPDSTAFAPGEPEEEVPALVPSEHEAETQAASSSTLLEAENETHEFHSVPEVPTEISQDPEKTKPLGENNGNSPTRSSRTPAPSEVPAPLHQEEMSNVISNLLAKAKAPMQDAPETRKRGRILGRVASNLSTGSTNRSRATSVDPTAPHGCPVGSPPHGKNDQTANERIQMLLNGDRPPEDVDFQPPATQLQYEDPDSTEAREIVMAKMRGEKVQKRSGIREKTITLGDIAEQPRPTRRAARGLR